jgi:hypothetical protein
MALIRRRRQIELHAADDASVVVARDQEDARACTHAVDDLGTPV